MVCTARLTAHQQAVAEDTGISRENGRITPPSERSGMHHELSFAQKLHKVPRIAPTRACLMDSHGQAERDHRILESHLPVQRVWEPAVEDGRRGGGDRGERRLCEQQRLYGFAGKQATCRSVTAVGRPLGRLQRFAAEPLRFCGQATPLPPHSCPMRETFCRRKLYFYLACMGLAQRPEDTQTLCLAIIFSVCI